MFNARKEGGEWAPQTAPRDRHSLRAYFAAHPLGLQIQAPTAPHKRRHGPRFTAVEANTGGSVSFPAPGFACRVRRRAPRAG